VSEALFAGDFALVYFMYYSSFFVREQHPMRRCSAGCQRVARTVGTAADDAGRDLGHARVRACISHAASNRHEKV